MLKKICILISLITISCNSQFVEKSIELKEPNGWGKAGSKPNSYDMGIEENAGYDRKNAATIRSNKRKIDGFGTLMQNMSPGIYHGKRLKLTAYMKSKNVKGWAGMWLRIDQDSSYKPLAFDNMVNRPITGTTDWKQCTIVLDVPKNASNIAFGCLLSGTGQVWFDKLQFDETTEPATGIFNKKPKNLDFEE